MKCLICYITFFIMYQLALTFIGVSVPTKMIWLSVLFASVTGYISKIYLEASAPIQTILVMVTCTGMLHWLHHIPLILSLIGSLLSVITLTMGSMLLACPLLFRLGYAFPLEKSGNEWLWLTLLELIIPMLVLVVLKISKSNLIKYFETT